MTTPTLSRLCRFVGRSLGLAGFGLLLVAAPAGAEESDWIIDVPVAVDSISAEHLLDPVASPGAHSVVPVCASFVPVDRPLPSGTSLRYAPIVVDVVEQLNDGIVPPTIPVASASGPSCTLQHGQIIEFAKSADDWLMPANNSMSIEVSVTLEPGRYHLAVESWDNHFTRWTPTDDGWTAVVQPTQTEERYRVVGRADGQVVFESKPTEDLADRTIRRTEGAIVLNPSLGARPFEVETGVTTSDTAHAFERDNETAVPTTSASSASVTSAPAARASTTSEGAPSTTVAVPPAQVSTTVPPRAAASTTAAAPNAAAPLTAAPTTAAPTTAAPTTSAAPTTTVSPRTAAPAASQVETATGDTPQAIATTVGSATTAIPTATSTAPSSDTPDASTATTESVPEPALDSSTTALADASDSVEEAAPSSTLTETSGVADSRSTGAVAPNDTTATSGAASAAGNSAQDAAATTSTARAAATSTTALRSSDEDVFGEEYAYNLYERGLTTGEPPSTPLAPGLGIAMLLGLIGGTSLVGGGAIALRLITRPAE